MENNETRVNEFSDEFGTVNRITYPIVYANGLPSVMLEELVKFDNDTLGQIQSIGPNSVEILTLSNEPPKVGSRITRTGETLKVPVGDYLLGSSIDPFGHSIFEEKPVLGEPAEYRPLHTVPLGIDQRKEIKHPLETGVTVVDLLIPLGKGQRELVLGDRKIGKTNFLLQTMLSQARKGSICIYAGIGKKKIDIRKVGKFFTDNRIEDKTLIVATSSSDSLGMIFITPYAAMSMAEYYRDQGHDVLLVLDDLSTHAKFYREISLLAKRFPGRGSYPGDIFYTHSKLLERAGNFVSENDRGEVSLTCLPVAETVESDISGYIQTNLMSITDGHVFFDKDVFLQGHRPAVNYFLSVTRVGRQTQTPVRWGINRELNTFLDLYEKTRSFIHFGAELNEGIRATLSMGDKIYHFFEQGMNDVVEINVQILVFCLIWVKVWDNKGFQVMTDEIHNFVSLYRTDEQFKQKIDDLAEGSKDFNVLLGRVSENLKEIKEKIQIKTNGKQA